MGLTIALLVASREHRFHRGVVRESQGQAALVYLAALRRPLAGRLDHIEAARQQVVDRARTGGGGEPEALVQLGEEGGALLRS